MKYIITVIFVAILSGLGYGFYVKSTGNPKADVIIGICVLAIAFIFMPLFIYHRYKNKNIEDFKFDNYRKDLEEHLEKEKKKDN